MGSGTTTRPGRRTWTVEIRPLSLGRALLCDRCGPVPVGPGGVRASVVAHLAHHARGEALAYHLRTCQCGQHGCQWHPRHRGCGGPLVLLLARERSGCLWRLSDVCRACAAVTADAAVVAEPLRYSPAPPPRRLALAESAIPAPGQSSSTPFASESSLCEQGSEEVLFWTDPSAYG